VIVLNPKPVVLAFAIVLVSLLLLKLI